MNYIAAGYTDIGIKKTTNQDSYTVKIADTGQEKIAFAILCDGMGGLAKGEVASAHLVKVFSEWFNNDLPDIISNENYDDIQYQWNELIQRNNQIISDYGNSINVQLGSTLTCVLFVGDTYYFIHVGDSRLYEINNECSKILTIDQTLVAREVRRGNMTLEQAENDPRRNVLLQCVGASKVIEPQFESSKISKGSVYMLCSDGFRHKVTQSEIERSFSPNAIVDKQSIFENAKHLVDMNKERNETDNITTVLIKAL